MMLTCHVSIIFLCRDLELVMLSKQGIFNCDEITIGLLPGLPQICMIYIYIQCVCTDD